MCGLVFSRSWKISGLIRKEERERERAEQTKENLKQPNIYRHTYSLIFLKYVMMNDVEPRL